MKIPIYQPSLTGKEKQYVNDCLDENWISSKGKYISKFELNFSKYVGSKHSISVSNGTVALHLALSALGIEKGDEVLVPSLTYIASVNCISYTGATPVFVDSFPDTWQINFEDLEKKITKNTKAIIVVHVYGYPCNMEEIMKIALKYNIKVIEDCAEALGSKINNIHVGSFGDIATYSFYGNKTITTGEGGMVTTNSQSLYSMCNRLKTQGLAKNKEYWHDIIGFNYRMTNICAAIGLAQLHQLDKFLERKKNLVMKYKHNLQKLPISFLKEERLYENSNWMINILVDNQDIRSKLRNYLEKNEIETRPMFYPIHTMQIYKNYNQDCKVSEELSLRGINLPSWPGLNNDQINFICNKIKEFYQV